MKKKVSHIFIYTFLFFLGLGVGLFAVNTYVGHYLLSKLATPQTPTDTNLANIAKFYIDFTDSLSQVENLILEIDVSKKAPLCQIICAESSFATAFDNYDAQTLVKYYKNSPTQALKDPAFRLLIDKLYRYSRMLPIETKDNIRELIEQNQIVSASITKTLLASAQFQSEFFLELPRYLLRLRRALSEEELIEQIRELRMQCHKNLSSKEITQQCNSLMKDYGVTQKTND